VTSGPAPQGAGPEHDQPQHAPGTVHLVGAGPGDPGLVTVRGVELVAMADVLAYDRLIPPGLVELAPEGCELVDVGKLPARPTMAQGDINQLLVERALAGKRVVRLKGGDPFVFGRGGEEAEACVQAGVPFEIVPGVTSAIAGPAFAGVPVTHRDLSAGFAVVTGHEHPEKEGGSLDWDALARIGTLCVLMAVGRLASVADRLLAAGRDPSTPAVLVERASLPGQRVVRSTLKRIAADADAAGARPPAILVVGAVAGLAERLAWRPEQPLAGQVVLVTRAPGQAGGLAARLREQGAEPLAVPLIEIGPGDSAELARAVADLSGFDWVAFTSRNAVEALRGAVEAAGLDARACAGTKLAAVGPATEAALRAWGLRPDLVPGEATAAALGAAMPEGPGRVLLPRGDLARPELPEALAAKGWELHEVVAYRTVPRAELDPDLRKRIDGGRVHWVAFTSSSTVTGFLGAYGGPPPERVKVAAIGPSTAETCRAAGIRIDALAAEHTVPGLVAAIAAANATAG
jgi:uroporphyrinogen III methyltransferase/synthase